MPSKDLVIAAVVLLGVSGGALAGYEASASVDDFYTAPREPRYQALEPAPVTTSWATESRTFPTAPPPGSIWGAEIGRNERAFFDAGAVEREEPVRVHRASARTIEPVEPIVEEPVPEWVEDDPEPLPSAG